MDIRASLKDSAKLEKIKAKSKAEVDFPINPDKNVEIPVIMIHKEGQLVEYIRGFDNVKNYLKYGYNRIIKKCPYRHRKCIGEKCSLYFVHGGTGDCVLIWQMFKEKVKT
tara:strand:- start:530 stop:859 length:330 start_codon:yes stop_codon:yes gene_type:complete